ncbi:stevor PIR protein,putative [Plasmodium sp. DRC-Itaito]|nr:stevor PIR protein,putative [Plasmodium sp. DRC-Itaito]
MKIYYVKMLIFIFLISTLVLPYNKNCENSHYNRSSIQNNTQGTTIKSRLLAQTKNHNPHYHNDLELKEIIDKLNDEAIKKFQQSHEPYEQLKELVEKNGRKLTGGNGTEPMSATERELFETYEEVFVKGNHMLKSGMYPNDDDKSDKSSSCECIDANNTNFTKRKGKDKYLKHLKEGCTRSICVCSVGSAFLTLIGLIAAKKAAVAALANYGQAAKSCVSSSSLFNIFDAGYLGTAIQTGNSCASVASLASDIAMPASTAATTAITPFSIAIYILIAITVLLIILYIWLYRRRKRSWKHECKKHLCK